MVRRRVTCKVKLDATDSQSVNKMLESLHPKEAIYPGLPTKPRGSNPVANFLVASWQCRNLQEDGTDL